MPVTSPRSHTSMLPRLVDAHSCSNICGDCCQYCVSTSFLYFFPTATCICEGNVATFTCSQGTIHVLSATYGRLSYTVCPHISLIGQIQCEDAKALEKVRNQCEDDIECSFSVNNRFFGGDPCPMTFKYLSVTFECK